MAPINARAGIGTDSRFLPIPIPLTLCAIDAIGSLREVYVTMHPRTTETESGAAGDGFRWSFFAGLSCPATRMAAGVKEGIEKRAAIRVLPIPQISTTAASLSKSSLVLRSS